MIFTNLVFIVIVVVLWSKIICHITLFNYLDFVEKMKSSLKPGAWHKIFKLHGRIENIERRRRSKLGGLGVCYPRQI